MEKIRVFLSHKRLVNSIALLESSDRVGTSQARYLVRREFTFVDYLNEYSYFTDVAEHK